MSEIVVGLVVLLFVGLIVRGLRGPPRIVVSRARLELVRSLERDGLVVRSVPDGDLIAVDGREVKIQMLGAPGISATSYALHARATSALTWKDLDRPLDVVRELRAIGIGSPAITEAARRAEVGRIGLNGALVTVATTARGKLIEAGRLALAIADFAPIELERVVKASDATSDGSRGRLTVGDVAVEIALASGIEVSVATLPDLAKSTTTLRELARALGDRPGAAELTALAARHGDVLAIVDDRVRIRLPLGSDGALVTRAAAALAALATPTRAPFR